MNNIQTIVLAACVAMFAVRALPGQEAAKPAVTAKTGKVLLLKNQRVLEGDIIQEGANYRIRRRIGSSTVPGNLVLALCASREDAYAVLRSRANLRDPDERVRLARWCQFQGLLDLGLQEARAAYELQPKNKEAERLVRSLDRTLCAPAGAGVEEEPAVAVAARPEPEVELPVALNLACLTQFNNRVHPILMNTCATCHASERGGNFRITRTFGRSVMDGRSTRRTLAAALSYIDFKNWQASPLLVNAVGVHGGIERPPLEGRKTAAYKVMEAWVKQVVATSIPPGPKAGPIDPTPIARAPQPPAPQALVPQPQARPEPVVLTPPAKPEPIFASVGQPVTTPAEPSRPQTPTPITPLPIPPTGEEAVHTVSASTAGGPVHTISAKPEPTAPAPSKPVEPTRPLEPVASKSIETSTFAVVAREDAPGIPPMPPKPVKVGEFEESADDPFDPVIFNRRMHGTLPESK